MDEEENRRVVYDGLRRKQLSGEEREEILQIQSVFTIDRGYVEGKCLSENVVYTEEMDTSMDWTTICYAAFFKKDSFFIESREVFSLSVECHSSSEEERLKLREILTVRKWKNHDIYELVKNAETYDWVFQCRYYDSDGKLMLFRLNYQGHYMVYKGNKSVEERVTEAFGDS